MIKRLLFTGFILLSALFAGAQITYGVKISGGFAYQRIINSDLQSAGSIKTFNIKGIAQMPVKNDFWLEAGLGITGKGSVVNYEALTTTNHLTYAELPVNILRKFNFTDLGIFYLGAGGYVAAGLGGKLDYETPGSSTSDKVRFGNENDARLLDAGLNFTTGFEFRNKLTFMVACV